MKRVRRLRPAAAIGIAVLALQAGSAVASPLDAGRLFAPGANICTLVSSTAIDKAMGITFPPAVRSGTACFWQTGKLGDLNRTIVRISVLPGLPKSRTDATVALEKKSGATVTPVSLSGAKEGELVASKLGSMVSETLYGVYPQGELVVNLTGAKLTAAQAIATARAAVA